MALHYQTILSHFFFCPIPLALGHSSGTGKTTAVRCALSIILLGVLCLSKGTTEKYADISARSSLPFAIDDPKSLVAISDPVVALFNGAKATTIKRGYREPLSMPIIAANFPTSEQIK